MVLGAAKDLWLGRGLGNAGGCGVVVVVCRFQIDQERPH